MKPKRYTTEQIIANLRKVDEMINEGKTIAEAVREADSTGSMGRRSMTFPMSR